MRVINRARLMFLVRRQPGLTRAELSRITGLSKGTVSDHISGLLDAGLLYEDQGNGSRQRNTGLHLNRDAGIAVGVELAPDQIRGILTDASIRPLRRAARRLTHTAVESTTEQIVSLMEELLVGQTRRLLGAVVGVPGSTDAAGQRLVFSESLGWADVPLAAYLADRLPGPIGIVNRVRAGALGEHWLGAGVDVDDLIYVSVSSGIAAGILIGGQLFTGAYNNNGELGHITAVPGGATCICGNEGCLETVASMRTIVRAVQARREAGAPGAPNTASQAADLTAADVIGAARNGDPIALDEIRTASRYLRTAVAGLINLFNPAMVVIGGQLAEAGRSRSARFATWRRDRPFRPASPVCGSSRTRWALIRLASAPAPWSLTNTSNRSA
jgi:predicted NBD/HSP70 family sugar kinase